MLFQSIPGKTKPSILGELYFIFEYFSFLESIFQRRRITGKERKENTRRVKNSRRKKRKYLKKGKNVWFAEERITDKEKKENIWA